MTDDLTTRLLAAIEETEKIARATTGGGLRGWHNQANADLHLIDGFAHMVHNDPPTVLRRCAADRKIVEIHKPERAGGFVHCLVCCEPYAPEQESEAWPCYTIVALAEGYGLTIEPAP